LKASKEWENKLMGAVNIAALAQVKLLDGLAAEDLVALAANLQRRRYGKGQFIFQQGDPGLCLYLVESGKVKIASFSSEGKGLVLNLLGPGDFFGELALLDGEPRSADALAQEPCQLLLLQRDDFMHFLEARPHVAVKLLATVSRRLRHTTQQAEDIIFFDLPARLARVLLELAEAERTSAEEEWVITSRPTQAELAEMVGATRESVNKWLGVYEEQGLIRREGNQLVILQPEALRKRIY
jgi:CRP/FNR family cyclic AMP-dependent transcriptional regulator